MIADSGTPACTSFTRSALVIVGCWLVCNAYAGALTRARTRGSWSRDGRRRVMTDLSSLSAFWRAIVSDRGCEEPGSQLKPVRHGDMRLRPTLSRELSAISV